MARRKVEVVVISDLHLGTYGCHAEELAEYLDSVDPEVLVLNGDVVDFWYLHWRYWPSTHMKVVELIISKASQGVKVYYLTGNHDDVLRRFSELSLGNFALVDKLVLTLASKDYWFFHGDVLDAALEPAAFLSRFLTRLGGWGYDRLILINRLVNRILRFFSKPRVSLAKAIRSNSKEAKQHLIHFESLLLERALEKSYHGVVCGHVHCPGIKSLVDPITGQEVLYLNSGDWVEHLTALEFNSGKWTLIDCSKKEDKELSPQKVNPHIEVDETDLNS